MQYTRAEVKLVKRITVLSWQPLIYVLKNKYKISIYICHE